jgi:hypothetical protein
MSILDTIKNVPKFFELFQKGKEVANPETWKNATVATNVVVALLGTFVGLSKTFGYDLGLDDGTLQNLAAGIVASVGVVNAVMHVVTSKRVGV